MSDDPPPVTRAQLQRVNVVGVSGGGKSTFARRLAERLDAPHLEMDRLFWEPNWRQAEDQVFRQRVEEAIEPDRWVLDGNYHSRTVALKWRRATMVVWLDTPFARMLCRSVKRAVARAWTQQELWPGTGNRETFRQSFLSRNSVVRWAVTTYRPIRRRYAACTLDPEFADLRFVRLRRRRQVDAFFASVERAMKGSD